MGIIEMRDIASSIFNGMLANASILAIQKSIRNANKNVELHRKYVEAWYPPQNCLNGITHNKKQTADKRLPIINPNRRINDILIIEDIVISIPYL